MVDAKTVVLLTNVPGVDKIAFVHKLCYLQLILDFQDYLNKTFGQDYYKILDYYFYDISTIFSKILEHKSEIIKTVLSKLREHSATIIPCHLVYYRYFYYTLTYVFARLLKEVAQMFNGEKMLRVDLSGVPTSH